MNQDHSSQIPTSNQSPDNFMPPAQKSSKIWIVFTIILAIALIAVSVFGYYKWQQYRTLTGNLGAQINALQNQVASLDKQLAAAKLNQKTSTNTTSTTDEQQIKTAVINYTEGYVGAKNGQTFQIEDITINKSNPNFATVGVGDVVNGQRTSGYAVILKKVNNTWIVIYTGQNLDPEIAKRFGIPA